MAEKFLGEFLVTNQILTREQLDIALMCQKENNILLGALAIQKQYLTPAQVSAIYAEQQRTNEKFGSIAMDKGYLSQAQLQDLLLIQAENHIYLGEAIVKKGLLAAEQMQEYLNVYEKKIKKHSIVFEQELALIPIKEILVPALTITTNYFYRAGLVIKPDAIVDREIESPYKFLAEQYIDDHKYYYGLLLPRDQFGFIYRVLLGTDDPDDLEQKYEDFEQMLFNLNYLICTELHKQGFRCKHGAATSCAYDSSQCTIIKMIAPLSCFYLTYYY